MISQPTQCQETMSRKIHVAIIEPSTFSKGIIDAKRINAPDIYVTEVHMNQFECHLTNTPRNY